MQKSKGIRMTDANEIEAFVLSGNAHFVIKSLKTGVKLQYKLILKEKVWWVKVKLHGPVFDDDGNYTSSYQYIGFIKKGYPTYKFIKAKNVSQTDKNVLAFIWFLQFVGKPLPSTIEFYHIGRCGKCGRKLTDIKSIAIGLGPTCAKRENITNS